VSESTDSDPKLVVEETVNVQLLSPDGTAMDVPFTRKEFERLSREAEAANTEIGEYIKNKIERTVSADRAKALRDRASFLRYYDGDQQTLAALSDRLRADPMSMRDALEAIAAGLGDVADIDNIKIGNPPVLDYSDEVVAGVAYALVCQVGNSARAAKIFEQELQSLRERFNAAETEIAQKTAALRSINREGSTERLEARLADARAAERAVVAVELETLRSKVANLQSEIDELRAAKKKLREALERSKEKRT
jgi:prefoldin subunit 5